MMLNKTFHLLLLSLIPLLGFSQANSQYPDSGNKIRLGFQTTGDGLIWRDTQPNVGVYQPINNKAAWIVLDTVNNKFYHYKQSNNTWNLAGGSDTTSIAYVNTYGTQTVNGAKTFTTAPTFSTALLGGSGGTGITTFGAATRIPYAASTTALTTNSNLLYDGTRFRTNQIAIGDTASNTVGITNLLALSGGSGAGFTLKSSYDAPTLRSFTFLINAVGNVGFWNNNTSSYAYFINNSDNFLGIGTTSPSYKLDISGTVNTSLLALRSSTNPSSNNYVGIDFGTGNFNGSLPNRSSRILGFADGGNDAIGLSFYTSNAAAPTEKMRIDKNGNVGIGTTSPAAILQINSATTTPTMAFSQSVSNTSVQRGGFVWLNNNNSTVAAVIGQAVTDNVGTDLEFSTRPVGGSLTKVLTLASTGAATFSSSVTASGTIATTSSSGVSFINSSITTNNAYIRLVGSAHGFIAGREGSAGGQIFTGASAYASVIGSESTDNLQFATNNTVVMTIANGGNVGIGTASPSNKLNIVGQHAQSISLESYSNAYSDYQGEPTLSLNKSSSNTIGIKTSTRDNENLGSINFQGVVNSAFRTAAYLRVTQTGVVGAQDIPTKFGFYTSDGTSSAAERMTILANGNVGIGTTNPLRKLVIANGGFGVEIDPAGIGGANPIYFNYNRNTSTYLTPEYWALGHKFMVSGGSLALTVASTGAVTINNLGTGPVYSNSGVLSNTPPSDERLKNNITNISWGLNDILKLRPVSFNWKDDRANQGKQFGFIAQEVHSIMPEAIKIFGEDFKYLGLEKDAIYATLVKAVQELSAEIDILKQEIINLKNK